MIRDSLSPESRGVEGITQRVLTARLERSLRSAEANLRDLEVASERIQTRRAEWENDHRKLHELNDRLAQAVAESAELMAEVEEKNENLSKTNRELARANAHAAELMAIVELRDEEIQGLNQALSGANARAAELLAELELQAEELKARNEELDAFAHTVAHDLRNPLHIISGYAEVAGELHTGLSSEEIGSYLSIIEDTARKMVDITDGLLLLSTLHITKPDTGPLDMGRIVSEAQKRLVLVIEERQAGITVPETWPVALGYGDWVEEVWVNYLSNALKYGGCPPRLEVGATPQADNTVRYWVRDNGHGLALEEQGGLFTPFTRLGKVSVDGHGLGLSIVKRIVERLGGHVGIDSRVGKGSTFYFTLPAAPNRDMMANPRTPIVESQRIVTLNAHHDLKIPSHGVPAEVVSLDSGGSCQGALDTLTARPSSEQTT